MIKDVYKAYRANLADHIYFDVEGQEETIHLYPRQILELAVQLGIIDDYSVNNEVIYTQGQDGYFSHQTGEWVDMPDLVARVEFNNWLDQADYEDLEKIAQEFLNQKNNNENGNSGK